MLMRFHRRIAFLNELQSLRFLRFPGVFPPALGCTDLLQMSLEMRTARNPADMAENTSSVVANDSPGEHSLG